MQQPRLGKILSLLRCFHPTHPFLFLVGTAGISQTTRLFTLCHSSTSRPQLSLCLVHFFRFRMSTPLHAEVSPISTDSEFVASLFQPRHNRPPTGLWDKAAYFPDDKIVVFDAAASSTAPMARDTQSLANSSNTNRGLPDTHSDMSCEEQKSQPQWWRRYFLFRVIGVIVFLGLVVGSVVGGLLAHYRPRGSDLRSITSSVIPNNTVASVASSGVYLEGKLTFVMQTFWQNPNGSIHYIMSLDGKTFQGTRNVSLTVPPKVGSPISSTAFTDIAGLVYVSFMNSLEFLIRGR